MNIFNMLGWIIKSIMLQILPYNSSRSLKRDIHISSTYYHKVRDQFSERWRSILDLVLSRGPANSSWGSPFGALLTGRASAGSSLPTLCKRRPRPARTASRGRVLVSCFRQKQLLYRFERLHSHIHAKPSVYRTAVTIVDASWLIEKYANVHQAGRSPGSNPVFSFLFSLGAPCSCYSSVCNCCLLWTTSFSHVVSS